MSCEKNPNKIAKLACPISGGISRLSGKHAFYAGVILAGALGGKMFYKEAQAEKIREQWQDPSWSRPDWFDWSFDTWLEGFAATGDPETDRNFLQLVQDYGRNGILFEVEKLRQVSELQLSSASEKELLQEFDDVLSRYEAYLRSQPPNQQDTVIRNFAKVRVADLNSPSNQKAAGDLQKNFIGTRRQVETQGMIKALYDGEEVLIPPKRLSTNMTEGPPGRIVEDNVRSGGLWTNTWMAEGPLGRIVYDDLGGGVCLIQAIEPRIGREVNLLNRLEAASKNKVETKINTQEFSPRLKRVIQSSRFLSSIVKTSNDWAERLKNPDRKKAAVALQKNFIGHRLPKQKLNAINQDEQVFPERLSGNIWQVQGKLGQLFYEDLGSDQIIIRGIRPKLGLETQLRDSLLK